MGIKARVWLQPLRRVMAEGSSSVPSTHKATLATCFLLPNFGHPFTGNLVAINAATDRCAHSRERMLFTLIMQNSIAQAVWAASNFG